jgi:hypothetical protein
MKEAAERLRDFGDQYRLSANQRAFLYQLAEMVETVKPAGVLPQGMTGALDHDVLRITIPHRSDTDLEIDISADDREIVIGTLGDHHHFSADWGEDYTPWREEHPHPWYSYAVGYVADLLQGRAEIETTYKGRLPVHTKVTHFDDKSEVLGICHEGIPLVWRLLILPRTRREVRRPTFIA